MSANIIARVHFEADRDMRILLYGPDGVTDLGVVRSSSQIGPLVRSAARELTGSDETDVSIEVAQPPWLEIGMIVRLDAAAVDPAEGTSHPWAQVIGFLPVGGVLIAHPESGTAVVAPEYLAPVDPADLSPTVVDRFIRRARVAPPEGEDEAGSRKP